MHLKLTGAMLLVMVLDGAGYLIAVNNVNGGPGTLALVSALEDIFVAVAILTLAVGLVLPGTIAHSAGQPRPEPRFDRAREPACVCARC